MLSTKRRGVLVGAIVGLCAICIAVCTQVATPLLHGAEQAQAMSVAQTSEPMLSLAARVPLGGCAPHNELWALAGQGEQPNTS